MKHKSRKQKANEYDQKYSNIPIGYAERLSWLYDTLSINERQSYEIMCTRSQMISSLYYYELNVVLFEVPEGSPRPRFRIVNRTNFMDMAVANSAFVHVYSITGAEDNKFMRRMVDQGELEGLHNLICTPCVVDINTFSKTPSYFNKQEIILAEIGLERPIFKPDWDNLGKKYSDMFNANIWLDDTLVVDGAVHKYYSVLPRIEIRIRYLNMLYNKHQYNAITNRVDFDQSTDLSYFRRS